MTCRIRLKEGSVRIGVPQHIFIYLALTWEMKIGGGGGRQKYTFLERSLYWEYKNFKIRAIWATREKLLWQKPKIWCDLSASNCNATSLASLEGLEAISEL